MKHIVFQENDEKKLAKAVKEAAKSCYKSELLQIFTSVTDEKKLAKIIKKFTKKFPQALIIGTTTAGEISHARMYENSTVISLSLFKKTTLKADYVESIDKKSGVILSESITSEETKATIILSEGLHGHDYEGFIKGFKEQHPDNIIAGGLAGDNFKLQKTLIFLNNTIYNKGSVGVSFSGSSLFVNNEYNLNWTPIGKEFTITKATANTVHEIDNQSSVKIFKKYLGSDIFLNNAKSLPDFQLLYKEGSTIVSRTPMTMDGNSLVFAGPLKEGQKVQFGFSSASSVLSGSKVINSHIKNNPAEAIYIYSCIARKALLGNILENEFENFEFVAPTAGFFTYGEYYSTNINNALLNCTTTLLILSESSKKTKKGKKDLKKKKEILDDVTFRALTHFVKQTSDELNANVKLLNQYKNVVDASLLVSKTDKNGIINFVNENFCRTSKYSQQELLGQNHNIIRDKSVSSFIFKKLWATIQSGKVWRGKLSNRAKDGTIYYVDATVMPTYTQNNEIDGYIAVRQDITKQIIAKNKMKEKERFIKAIFDNQDNIVIYSSKTDGMLNANKTLYEYFDYKNFEDFKSQHKCICELFIDEEGYIHPKRDKDWVNTIINNPQIDHKAKMLTKDNTIRTFNIKINNINDEYITNLSDITNLEMALQKAYSSEQAKSIFLANMSHEIRTPLNGILGFTDVLRKKELDNDSKRYIDIIHKSGQSLLHVVNDILDFSKIESGELSLYETESNLFLEMEAAVSTFASSSREKHIDYYTYIDTNIPKTVICDSQRIKQIMNNLISNAIKFTPDGGVVRVNIALKEMKKQKAIINFSVKDSGIGIPQNKISTIFQAFSQADDSISREFGGTGLGLSISNKYAQMMGSRLKVKSEEGKWSEFYFELALPIVDTQNSIKKSFDMKDVKIDILQSTSKIGCGINEVVTTYLQTWACSYNIIESLDEIDASTDILIVCAKLFDEENCKAALDKFKKLHLIYIAGGDESFICAHEKFHLIEQPMTGSALFDKIVTITHNENAITETTSNMGESEKYRGNILIVEDNKTNQLLLSVMLDERGVNYKIVANGKEAVDEALKNDYDLLLMDVNMPVLDGVSATKQLREKGYEKAIVSLSANVLESDRETFIKAGANDTLNKPIISDELDKILEVYLKQKNEKMRLKFDEINIETLATALSLPNRDIIMKLLLSFSESAQDMIKTLNEKKLDKNILHAIKGMAGNLRFNELFTIAKNFEAEFENWDDNTSKQNSQIIISHLKKAVENIQLIDK